MTPAWSPWGCHGDTSAATRHHQGLHPGTQGTWGRLRRCSGDPGTCGDTQRTRGHSEVMGTPEGPGDRQGSPEDMGTRGDIWRLGGHVWAPGDPTEVTRGTGPRTGCVACGRGRCASAGGGAKSGSGGKTVAQRDGRGHSGQWAGPDVCMLRWAGPYPTVGGARPWRGSPTLSPPCVQDGGEQFVLGDGNWETGTGEMSAGRWVLGDGEMGAGRWGTGRWVLGCWELGCWVMDAGCWMLGDRETGIWMLGVRCWALRCWEVDAGCSGAGEMSAGHWDGCWDDGCWEPGAGWPWV